jgi:hypothetical protein
MTSTAPSRFDDNAALFGNRFVTQEVPSREFPENGMPAGDAMRLVFQESGHRRGPTAQPRYLRYHMDGAGGADDHRRQPAP